MPTNSLKQLLTPLQNRSTLQLTTLGRKTGKRHTVTTWFLVVGGMVYKPCGAHTAAASSSRRSRSGCTAIARPNSPGTSWTSLRSFSKHTSNARRCRSHSFTAAICFSGGQQRPHVQLQPPGQLSDDLLHPALAAHLHRHHL